MTRTRRRSLAVLLVAALALTGAALALALPQQQGSVDLLSQANVEAQGPGGSLAGSALVALGDINGDGPGDIAVGAPEASPSGRTNAGSVYVLDGQREQGVLDLTALSGRGYRIDGAAAGDQAGFALALVHLAGSGHPALAIGAPYASTQGRNESGAVYVVDLTMLNHDIDLAAGDPAVTMVSGPEASAQAGYALADAGDLNGDGFEDLLIGAPGASLGRGAGTGAAYVLFGSSAPVTADLASAGAAARMEGAAAGDRTGSAVIAAPLSGGGHGVLVGAPQASPDSRSAAGSAFLVPAPAPGSSTDLAAPPGGSTRFDGAAADDALGSSLAPVGDFAGAGTNSLALGAPQASPFGRTHAGTVFVVSETALPATADLSQLGGAGGPSGARIDGANPGDEAGWSVAALHDVNGDGVGDLVVGAPFLNSPTGQGREDLGAAYVLYGHGGGGLDLASLGSRGYRVTGARQSDEAGTAVADGGDFNGDGRPDVLVGSPFAENAGGQAGGSAYVVYGFGRPAVAYPAITGVAGQPIAAATPTIHATGKPSFSVSPTLPAGLSLNTASGAIDGVPAGPSTGTYAVQMNDLAGVVSAPVTISIASTAGSGGGPGQTTGQTVTVSIPAPAPAGGARACRAGSAPAASVTRLIGSRRALDVRGTAAACGTRVKRVAVAVARRVRGGCRQYVRRGRFSRHHSCRRAHYLRAHGASGWHLRVGGPLPAGRYTVTITVLDARGRRSRGTGATVTIP